MKKKKPVVININLAPKDPFYESVLGKTLNWALSVGRYIVIFTELVVILSFVARFSLDRQVTDLNGAIEQKRRVIQSYGELEDNFRAVQLKLETYQQVEQQTNIAEVFPKLAQVVPQDVKLTELVIQPNGISLGGVAPSQKSLNFLINNVQLLPDFTNLFIDRIETQSDKIPGFLFELRAGTKTAVVQKKTQDTK